MDKDETADTACREIVLVEWRDSVALGGWQYRENMRGWSGKVIQTVGLVVEETDADLVLAMSTGNASEGEVLCNWMSVPKVCILRRVRLMTPAAVP